MKATRLSFDVLPFGLAHLRREPHNELVRVLDRALNRPLSSAILLAVSVSLLWRRRAPLVVASVVAGGVLLQAAVTGVFAQSPALALCQAIALYSLGAHSGMVRAVVGGLIVAASIQLKGVIAPPSTLDEGPFVALFWWLLCVSTVAFGMLVRTVRRSAQLQRQARAREADRAAHARAAVAEERQRIARELHDVVSHNVSATILQAGAAEELLRSDPERAGEALQSIREMGREAIGEMRRMLGILRASDDGAPPVPQPRLADLPALLERTREAGIAAELVVEGPVIGLPPGIELSVYRIVQEALTNAFKHSGASSVVVTIRYADSRVEVEVRDNGRGVSAPDNGTGHGLLGMRERVGLFGGELSTGPGTEGGYRVMARFPTPRTPA